MGDHRTTIAIPSNPSTVDVISLRNVQLPLPTAPEAWHRPGQRQPCTASIRLSYSSAMAAAATDDVSLSVDYGKLYRRVEQTLNHGVKPARRLLNLDGNAPKRLAAQDVGQDIHITAGTIASCALDFLAETAVDIRKRRPQALRNDFGQCEVRLDLPKALLRADRGLSYCCVTAHCPDPSSTGPATVILSEEFRIERIRCYCILGINPHERVEKQGIFITLSIGRASADAWRSAFLHSYQEMVRCIAEAVDASDFQSVEALATFVARIAVIDFGNEEVTALVEKPNALAFSEGTGVEITRSRDFFLGGSPSCADA